MIGSIIGGIASIVGGSQTARAQREANATNLRINQMNNEFNAREAEKAFQRESSYNDKIRAEDREYNSAEAQVERYRQAGLNPAMMMQGQSAGVAQSNGVSSSAASASSSAPQQGTVYDYSMLGQAIQGMLERNQKQQLITEEVNGLRIENQYKAAKIIQELNESRSREMTNKAKAKLDNTIEGMQNQILYNQTITAEAQVQQSRTQSMLNLAKAAYIDKEIVTFDERHRSNMKEIASRTLLNAANMGLSQAQTEHEIAKKFMTEAQTKKINLDWDTAKRMANSLVQTAANEARNTYYGSPYSEKMHGLKAAMDKGEELFDKYITKPSNRLWKDTKRSFGLYFD